MMGPSAHAGRLSVCLASSMFVRIFVTAAMVGTALVGMSGALASDVTLTTSVAARAPAAAAVAPTWGAVTTRASVGVAGQEGNHFSDEPAISGDGRFVAFYSKASNLVPEDTNNRLDVFVRDRVANVTRRVSVGPHGRQGNGISYSPSISPDGRYIVFSSTASNLIPRDTNHRTDVFVRDRVTKVTRRVSVGPHARQGNGRSYYGAISADGRYVAFSSEASNLVAADTNDSVDVFVRDRVTKMTRRVSVGPHSRQANDDSYLPALSAHGRYIAFESPASNLVPKDTNDKFDVFVRDRASQTTRRMSLTEDGGQFPFRSYDASISPNGRFVAFTSGPSGRSGTFTDVYLRDRVMRTTELISVTTTGLPSKRASGAGTVFPGGHLVAFSSSSPRLVTDDTNLEHDVFVRDRTAAVTTLASVATDGTQGDDSSFNPAISADGEHLAFTSVATTFVAPDTNAQPDVFVRDRQP